MFIIKIHASDVTVEHKKNERIDPMEDDCKKEDLDCDRTTQKGQFNT